MLGGRGEGALAYAKIIGKLEKPKENLKILEIIGNNWNTEGFFIVRPKINGKPSVFQLFSRFSLKTIGTLKGFQYFPTFLDAEGGW